MTFKQKLPKQIWCNIYKSDFDDGYYLVAHDQKHKAERGANYSSLIDTVKYKLETKRLLKKFGNKHG